MYSNTSFKRAGFTLMELMLVMAILIALIALAAPALMSQQKRSRIRQAEMRIKNFEMALESYATENSGYPTTEQGLEALIFLPDNYGQVVQPNTMNPMNPGGMTDPTAAGTAPGAFGAGEAMSVGPEMLNGGATAGPMGTNPMNPATPMATNPMDPMNPAGGMTGGMTDPTMSGMTGAMGTGMTTGSMTGWTQPFGNPQLYTMKRQRPVKYLDNDTLPLDPWRQPYRYDNNRQYSGLNQTGDAKPAIWSAGPDGQDGTDDDIRNWDPAVAQNLIAQKQQQIQTQGQYGTNPMMGTGTDPMNPMMGTDPMMGTGANPMNPMPTGTNPMNPMPTGTNPMNPMPTGTNPMNPAPPMGTNPMNPAPPMGTNPMNPMPTGTNPMNPAPPMGTNPMNPAPPMGM